MTKAQPDSENFLGFIKIEKVEENPVLATLCAASSNPSSQGISRGQRQQGRYVKSKIEKTACFPVGMSLDVTRAHKLTSPPLP